MGLRPLHIGLQACCKSYGHRHAEGMAPAASVFVAQKHEQMHVFAFGIALVEWKEGFTQLYPALKIEMFL